jgi:hypothetical protein
MIVQLVVAYKHDSTLRVYDTVHGREVYKPLSLGITGDTIADVSIDTHSNSVFTTSTWLPSVHCWSLDIDANNSGKYMNTSKYMRDVALAELGLGAKDKQLPKTFTKLIACIQQQPPSLLDSLALVKWSADMRRDDLLKLLLDPQLSPLAVQGKSQYTARLLTSFIQLLHIVICSRRCVTVMLEWQHVECRCV